MRKPVQSTAKIPQPTTALREHEKLTPHRAGIATLPGQDSALESWPESAADRTRIAAGSEHPGSGTGSHPARQQGRATTRRGQHPTPRL